MEAPRLLTVAEVADILRIGPWQVTKWCRSGKLRASKPGNAWLIRSDAVDELLAEHSNEAASA